MKKLLFIIAMLWTFSAQSQSIGYLRYDTVKVMKQGGSGELMLINSTRDSLGFLANVGGGKTQFKRVKKLNDSTFVFAGDTLEINGNTSSDHAAVTLAPIGSSPNANGASITAGQVLNLQPASASFGGVVNTSAQTFAGQKTLANPLLTGLSNVATSKVLRWNSSTGAVTWADTTAATTYDGSNFILNQTTLQSSSNFYISGTGRAGTGFGVGVTPTHAFHAVGGDIFLTNDAAANIQHNVFTSASAASTARVNFLRGRGTLASSLKVVNGDNIGELNWSYIGTDGNTGGTQGARLFAEVEADAGTGNFPVHLTFSVINGFSTSEKMRVSPSSIGFSVAALPLVTGLDLGAQLTPFRDLYLHGSGTYGSHGWRFTGTPTGLRTITVPDVTGTLYTTSSGSITSAQLATSLSDEVGTDKVVFNTSPAFVTKIEPSTNDGAAIGTTTKQWSDLFLAEGGVIDWDNSDATLTQSGNNLTIAGADLFSMSQTLAGALQFKVNNASSTGTSVFLASNNISGTAQYGVTGSAYSAYGALAASNAFLYTEIDMTFMADAAGGDIKFAAGGSSERARFSAQGNLLLAGTTDPASAVGAIVMSNGTAPSGNVANTISLYTTGGELTVRDASGNTTTLSPHNFSRIPGGASEKLAWSYNSEKDGEYISVDMLKLARLLEKLTGEKLVYTGKIEK